ncbi:hypothetical protein XF35_35920, partial [Streptomyces platensis subsp. clarensis]|nr:hypothetical protein [Streptomyces platensis subsp. clarensis]
MPRSRVCAPRSATGWACTRPWPARTGLAERYVREWLAAQVAGEYVNYAPDAGTYLLPAEHAAVLADPELPTYAAGFFTA